MNKWSKIGLTVGMGTAVLTTAHFVNKFIFKLSISEDKINSDLQLYKWKFGDITYTVSGEGDAVLLVHDLNSYSSSSEWKNVISYLSKYYTVYAIDLLGCGHSDKPNITYTTYMYTQLINDFILNVIGHKASIIASGASTPIALMTAYNNENLIDKIILVNPADIKATLQSPEKSSNITRILLNSPIVGTLLYNIFMNRHHIRKNLYNDGFSSASSVTTDIVNTCHTNAHLGGSNAKFLFTSTECHYTCVSISKAIRELNNCIYIVSGNKTHDFKHIKNEYLSLNPAIEFFEIKNAKGLPQIERPEEFCKIASLVL